MSALALKQVSVSGVLEGNMVPMVHGTLWTIKYEFDCYLTLAALGAFGLLRTGARRAAVYLVLAAGLAAAVMTGLPTIDHGVAALLISSPNQWPDLFPFFLAGSAFYVWRARIPNSPVLLRCGVVVFVVTMLTKGAWLALLICGTYAVLYVALSNNKEFVIGGRRVDLSYGVYLYGWPVQQLLLYALGPQLGPLGLFTLSMTATFILAWLSWTLVERPCLRLARSKLRPRRESLPA